ncbi:arginine--tRNA ligase [Candidatus Uhrbacteria bacterium]|nr:arginine--tRNA ligase [Candidatus Uhrbacteria bacterium]MBD3284290.1 arginine--tRNA ligase [Candidatus Uhrbacteria bacterium]
MKNLWFAARDHIAQRIGTVLGVPVTAGDLVLPPKPDMGDLAFGCFTVAKELQQPPTEVAEKIVKEFGTVNRLVEKMEAAGPFVNITLATGEFIHRMVQDVEHEGERYAVLDIGKQKRILFEYAQPNTHKSMHVGHLRNLVLGSSIVAILKHAGWDVVTASYHGDVGAHVAKCLWWFVKQHQTQQSSEQGESSWVMDLTLDQVYAYLDGIPKEQRNGVYLGQLYTDATKAIAADESLKSEVSVVQRALESHDPVWHKLWQETRRWSLEEFTDLFEELGVDIDRQYLESEVVDEGQRIVNELLEQGVAEASEGAIVVDLEDQKLGKFLIRKSDGTSLYATKDLALAQLKKQEYPKMERSILLVDNRQSLYFKQLFATLKRMGYDVPTAHIGYEFLTLKSGAMSSREGNVVTYPDFRNEVYRYAWKETKVRHESWSQGQINYTAWAIAIAGIKFGLLRQDPERIFTFDLEESLSFDGDTGPYVQYAIVRLESILRRANYPDIRGNEEPNCRVLEDPKEKALAIAIARLGDVAPRAAEEMRPSLVAHWCLETARISNAFYRDLPVLDAEEDVKNARLRLAYAARDGLTMGLKLLGIPVPEAM